MPWWKLGAGELAAAYRRGAFSPVEIVEGALDRIAAHDSKLNAVIHVAEGSARTEAAASAERYRTGAPRSALDGVPLTIKDSILVRGMPATWGSRVTGDFTPETDELPVARLREAGAIILGKTNVPEFTIEGYTGNLRFGATRNPWNLDLTPGGSSGGAVASVAAGFTPAAIATDGGGSIRRPASYTGLAGLKTSAGRVPRLDHFPSILFDCETIGPIARSIADLKLIDAVISRPDSRDSRARISRDVGKPPDRLRIAWMQRIHGHPLDPEISKSVEGAARVFEGLGHEVDPSTHLPFALDELTALWTTITQAGLASLRERHFGCEAFDRLAAPKYVEIAKAGQAVPATAYLAAIEALATLRRTVAAFFERFDLVLTPAAAALPWPADEAYPLMIDGRVVGPRGHAVYTGWVNMCGHPAVALPSTPSSAGLPIGFQLVGRFGADDLLLALAAAYEAARPWVGRWPPNFDE